MVKPRIHQTHPRTGRVQRSHLAQELRFDPLVVVIEKGYVFSARDADTRVYGGGLARILGVPNDPNPGVHEGPYHVGSIVRRTVVHDDKLVVIVGLGQHAADGAGQQCGAVIRGDYYAYFGVGGCSRHDLSTTACGESAPCGLDWHARNEFVGSVGLSSRYVRGS